jgi:hypothetical protein
MKQYTVTVIATHQIREAYVVFSDKSIEELEQDIKDDPWQIYCGDSIDMINDEFIECTELIFDGISKAEETP